MTALLSPEALAAVMTVDLDEEDCRLDPKVAVNVITILRAHIAALEAEKAAFRAWLESEEAVKLLRDLTADYEYVQQGAIELDKDGYARAALAAIREKLTP